VAIHDDDGAEIKRPLGLFHGISIAYRISAGADIKGRLKKENDQYG
jgi:hypothetical protein